MILALAGEVVKERIYRVTKLSTGDGGRLEPPSEETEREMRHASIVKAELNIDCDYCQKPIKDGDEVMVIVKGKFTRQGMHIFDTNEVVVHQSCVDEQLSVTEPVTP